MTISTTTSVCPIIGGAADRRSAVRAWLRPARWIASLLLLAVTCGVGIGCQIDRHADPFYSLIDNASDTEIALDHLYHPKLDATRLDNHDGCKAVRRGYPQ